MFKIYRLPTYTIVDEIMWYHPTVIHLVGRLFWDGDHKVLLIVDKTLKQHKAKYHKVID